MAGFTNKGKRKLLALFAGIDSIETNYYIALVTAATAPDADTNTMADLTEITAGNGYTSGGYQLTPGATDFDTINEDDTNDRGDVQIKDVAWTASGGAIPSAGNDARYAVLTDDNGTVSLREIYAYWDLGAGYNVSDGQTLTLQDLELRVTES